MKNLPKDWDSSEAGALGDARQPLGEIQARHAHCPSPDLLRAAALGALPEDLQTLVDSHAAQCPLCRALRADLESAGVGAPEVPPLSPEQQSALYARIVKEQAQSAPARAAAPHLFPWRFVAAFGVVVAVIFVARWLSPGEVHAPATPVVVEQPSDVFKLVMPGVRVRASIALVMRGGENAQQYLSDLAPALDLYRAANYRDAARRLTPLTAKYPKAVEAHFYLGLSLLAMNDNVAAEQALLAAEKLREPEFASDVAWYLGLAFQRNRKKDEAAARWKTLCRDANDPSQPCRALAALKDPAAAQ